MSGNLYPYSYNWIIKNLGVCRPIHGQSLCSPPFTTERWGNTKWRLIFYPKGDINFEYMSLYLQREADDSELKEIVMDFKFTMSVIGSCVSVTKTSNNICFREKDVAGFVKFANSTVLITERGISRSGVIYKIRCGLSQSDEIATNFAWNPRVDFQSLSRDLTRLYLNGQHHDVVLCTGHAEFYAHKAVLASRSPKFMRDLSLQAGSRSCARMDMSAVSVSVLQSLLLFLYSGRLDIPKNGIPQGLLAVAAQYEVVDLVRRIQTFPKEYHASTDMEYERMYVTWAISASSFRNMDYISFRRVLKCEEACCDKVIFYCQIIDNTEQVNESYMQVSIQLKGVDPKRPISLLYSMQIIDNITTHDPSILQLHVADHVFESDSEWRHRFWINDIHVEVGKILHLGFEIYLSDGASSCSLDEADPIPQQDSGPVGMDEFDNFSYDFQKLLHNYTFTDFSIICGDDTFQAHRAILYARSPVFEKMLTHDMIEKRDGSVVVSDIRPTVMMSMLSYIYSGLLGDLTHRDFCDLYEAADKYGIFTLKEKCYIRISTGLNSCNVGNVLDLAQLHFDSRMESVARNYIQCHGIQTSLSNAIAFD